MPGSGGVPPEPPSLVRGRTAYWWAVCFLWFVVGEGAGLALFFGLGVVSSAVNSSLLFALCKAVGLVNIFVLLPYGAACLLGFALAHRRERKHGYTTLARSDQDLWQLAPRSGVVVRSPTRTP
jgi:hypothetical protein